MKLIEKIAKVLTNYTYLPSSFTRDQRASAIIYGNNSRVVAFLLHGDPKPYQHVLAEPGNTKRRRIARICWQVWDRFEHRVQHLGMHWHLKSGGKRRRESCLWSVEELTFIELDHKFIYQNAMSLDYICFKKSDIKPNEFLKYTYLHTVFFISQRYLRHFLHLV